MSFKMQRRYIRAGLTFRARDLLPLHSRGRQTEVDRDEVFSLAHHGYSGVLDRKVRHLQRQTGITSENIRAW